jgi:hypothetical protein
VAEALFRQGTSHACSTAAAASAAAAATTSTAASAKGGDFSNRAGSNHWLGDVFRVCGALPHGVGCPQTAISCETPVSLWPGFWECIVWGV